MNEYSYSDNQNAMHSKLRGVSKDVFVQYLLGRAVGQKRSEKTSILQGKDCVNEC